jgi:hypothetical protein
VETPKPRAIRRELDDEDYKSSNSADREARLHTPLLVMAIRHPTSTLDA